MLCDRSDNTDGSRVQTGTFETTGTYRYLKVILTGFPGDDFWPGFAEFKVYEKEAPEEILPTGITLSQDEALLTKANETLQLAAEVTPENADHKTVIWESSNQGVAAVNQEGLVSAKANGTAVITAAVEGTELTAACLVTVEIPAPVIPVSKVELDKTAVTLTKTGEQVQIKAVVSPRMLRIKRSASVLRIQR